MYHLFVVFDPDAYDNGSLVLPFQRVLRGHTRDALTEKYAALTKQAITHLKEFPALFAYEHDNEKDARIGWITDVRTRDNSVRIRFDYDNTLPAIPWDQIDSLAWDLDVGAREMHQTHWALKDIDLIEVLIEADLIPIQRDSAAKPNRSTLGKLILPRDSIEVTPSVFRVPMERREDRLVSVMMPFAAEFDPVYASIRKVCESLGLTCQRADEIFDESEIVQDVFSLIFRSTMVICDFTTRNPNVYYETGIAHTLGRPVVPLTQRGNDVSFDLQHHRFILYANNAAGLNAFRPKLAARLRTLLRLRNA